MSKRTATDEWGWSIFGFDPDKTDPPWRQLLIDACEFVAGCAHQDPEAARLAEMADLWLAKLHKYSQGVIPALEPDKAMLVEVLDDYADYEATNGRMETTQQTLPFASARVVLRQLHRHASNR